MKEERGLDLNSVVGTDRLCITCSYYKKNSAAHFGFVHVKSSCA
eukprot:COSAG01_NODE_32016_length_587_cov_3.047131_1_plen_43_part_01